MTHEPRPEESGGDYSYDLVHEDVQRPHHRSEPTPRSPHPVATGTPEDANGDYSYDLAHEISKLNT